MHSYEICPQDYGAANHGVAPNHSSVCHYLSVICHILLVELVLLLNLEPGVESLLGFSWSWAGSICALLHPRLGTTGNSVLGRKLKNMWEETHNNASWVEILSCMTRSTLNSHWGQMGAEHLSDKTEVVVHWLEKCGIHWVCTIYQLIRQ